MAPAHQVITVTLNPAIDRVVAVDHFQIGRHQDGRELLRVAAGKGINVSRAMAKMGAPCAATGFLGEANRSVYAPLFSEGRIADEFVTIPGATRENITITDTSGGSDTHIRMPGLTASREAVGQLREKLRKLARVGNIVIFSGSPAPGMTTDDFAGLVDLCIGAGARVAVDTSGPALAAMKGKRLWLVKPNLEEFPQLMGEELGELKEKPPIVRGGAPVPPRNELHGGQNHAAGQSPAGHVASEMFATLLQSARELARRIPNVILTGGAEGAWLFTGGDKPAALHAAATVDPQEIRSTVGCGDAMLGAYVAGVTKGLSARDAFLQAVAVASASALAPGPADFDPAVAKTLLSSICVTEL